MSDRVLRGSRLGASSYEDDREIAPAPRQSVTYECPQNHRVELPFSTEAEIPAIWECPRCGADALRLNGDQPEAKHVKPARTHWDMLLERRSLSDLEELLSERLELLRAGEIGPDQGHQETPRTQKASKPAPKASRKRAAKATADSTGSKASSSGGGRHRKSA